MNPEAAQSLINLQDITTELIVGLIFFLCAGIWGPSRRFAIRLIKKCFGARKSKLTRSSEPPLGLMPHQFDVLRIAFDNADRNLTVPDFVRRSPHPDHVIQSALQYLCSKFLLLPPSHAQGPRLPGARNPDGYTLTDLGTQRVQNWLDTQT